MQLIWRITISTFPICTFRAFLCLACYGPLSAEGGSRSHFICCSVMLVSVPSGARETLDKLKVMVFLRACGLDMALSYMVNNRGRDVDWLGCTSSFFLTF